MPSIEVTEADSSARPLRRDGLWPVRNSNIGSKPIRWEERRKHRGLRISVKKALMSLGKKARDCICKELVGLHNIKCWGPIRYSSLSTKQKKKMIRSFISWKRSIILRELLTSSSPGWSLEGTCKTGASKRRQRRHLQQYLFLQCIWLLLLPRRRIVRLGLQT